jgi:hypothetical protein
VLATLLALFLLQRRPLRTLLAGSTLAPSAAAAAAAAAELLLSAGAPSAPRAAAAGAAGALAVRCASSAQARLTLRRNRLASSPHDDAALHAALRAATAAPQALAAATAAARRLYPNALAIAAASLAPGRGEQRRAADVADLALDAAPTADAALVTAALRSMLQPRSAFAPLPASVAFVCGAAPGVPLADSSDIDIASFADWTAAHNAGAKRLLTARAAAAPGGDATGLLLLAFARDADCDASSDLLSRQDALLRIAAALGAALAALATRDAAAAADASEVGRAAFSSMVSLQDAADAADLMASPSPRVSSARLSADVAAASSPRVELAAHPDATVLLCAAERGAPERHPGGDSDSGSGALGALWRRFDALAADHGVFRVDAASELDSEAGSCMDAAPSSPHVFYAAVCGMLPRRADHGAAAMRMALDMHAAAAGGGGPGGGPLRLRIGLASGAVSCGVAGGRLGERPRLCVFGAATDAARRLAAAAPPGCVALSGAAHASAGLASLCPDAATRRSMDPASSAGPDAACHVVDAFSAEALLLRGALSWRTGGDHAASETGAPTSARGADSLAGGSDDGADDSAGDDAGTGERRRRRSAGPGSGGSSTGGGVAASPGRGAHKQGRRSLPGGWLLSSGPLRSPRVSASENAAAVIEGHAARAAGRAAAAEGAAAAATALGEAAVTRFAYFTAFAISPTAAYALMSFRRRGRYLPAARACVALFAAIVVPFATRGALPPPRRAALVRAWPAACLAAHALAVACITLVLMDDFVAALMASPSRHPALTPSLAARQYFWGVHAALTGLNWVIAQLPMHAAFCSELLRAAAYVIGALSFAADEHVLTWQVSLAVILEATACAAGTCVALVIGHAPHPAATAALAGRDLCPPALRGARRALQSIGDSLRRRLFGGEPLLDATSAVVFGFFSVALAYDLFLAPPASRLELPAAASRLTQLLFVVLAANAAAKARPTSARALDIASEAAAAAAAGAAMAQLRARLVGAASEAAILRAGGTALAELFPGCGACALGAFGEAAGGPLATLTVLTPGRAGSAAAEAKAALTAALPPGVAADKAASVARAAAASSGRAVAVLDSRDLPLGVASCADWAAARAAGLGTDAAVTAALHAGLINVGFMTLHFAAGAARAPRAVELDALRELSTVLGGAIFVRRALGIGRSGALNVSSSSRSRGNAALLPGMPLPPRRGASATQLQRAEAKAAVREARQSARAADGGDDADAATSSDTGTSGCEGGRLSGGAGFAPVAEDTEPTSLDEAKPSAEDAAALAALDAAAEADGVTLRRWSLDAAEFEDGELRRLFAAMMHAHGLLRAFKLSPSALDAFTADVAARYAGNPFHNWRHAFSVAHATWRLLDDEGAPDAPPLRSRLEPLDCLSLLLAALCHDLEHPGTTNAFQVNTGSALALRYNDASVLENHHAATMFAVLEKARLLAPLPMPVARALRATAVAAVLATDMSGHRDLHARVQRRLAEADATSGDSAPEGAVGPCCALSGGLRRDSAEDRQLLVAFVLHCADLCCPLMAPPVSRRVARELSREFEAQAAQERAQGLPVTVPLADGDAAKARMELGFIQFVVQPLYVTLERIAPAVGARCLRRIDANRQMWDQEAAVTSSSEATA